MIEARILRKCLAGDHSECRETQFEGNNLVSLAKKIYKKLEDDDLAASVAAGIIVVGLLSAIAWWSLR